MSAIKTQMITMQTRKNERKIIFLILRVLVLYVFNTKAKVYLWIFTKLGNGGCKNVPKITFLCANILNKL